MSLIDRLFGFGRLMRPANCTMMGFAVLVGSILADPNFQAYSWGLIFFGFVTGFLLTGASMALNDYYDRRIDAINEPHRPIPSGLIRAREAVVFAVMLSLIGLLFAWFSSYACFVVAIFSWLILAIYVTVGKRTGLPGNFLVSTCVAIPFIYGSILVTNGVERSVLLFAAMAFLSNTGREITKGVADVKGDLSQNVKTLAVRYGEFRAAVVAAFFFCFAVALSPIPLVLGEVSVWFLPLVLITDGGLILSSVLLLRDPSRENAKRLKNLILVWFVVALLAFIVGVLTR